MRQRDGRILPFLFCFDAASEGVLIAGVRFQLSSQNISVCPKKLKSEYDEKYEQSFAEGGKIE